MRLPPGTNHCATTHNLPLPTTSTAPGTLESTHGTPLMIMAPLLIPTSGLPSSTSAPHDAPRRRAGARQAVGVREGLHDGWHDDDGEDQPEGALQPASGPVGLSEAA